MRRFRLIVLAAVLVLAGCGGSEAPAPTTQAAPAPKLNVVATTTQLGDFVRSIAGNEVNLEVIVPPGEVVSTYKAQPDDITALARADVILRSGVGLDAWLEEASESEARAVTHDMSNGIRIDQRVVNGQPTPDPFYWMSPINARIAVANVADVLSQRDPAHAELFSTNERAYSAQLDSLRRDTERTLGSRVQRKLVTARNDVGYYTREFDIELVGAVDSVPRDELVNRIRSQQVGTVVLSSVGSATDAYAVARASGATVSNSSDVLYAESLGAPGTPEGTYIGAMRTNADVLVASLD